MHLQQIFRTVKFCRVHEFYIYHQTNRCRCQNTTPKNLLSNNTFPFTSGNKKKRKTRDSSSSLLFFPLDWTASKHLPFGNLRNPAGWPQQRQLWRRIRWSEFGQKNMEKTSDKKKHTHFLEIPTKAFRKNAHDKNFVLICWVWKLRHSNSTSTSDTEAAQILATPWGLSKTKKDHLLKNRGPKCGRFIGQLWPT